MKFTKRTQRLVNEYLNKPYVLGDIVIFHGEGNGSKNPKDSGSGSIVGIDGYDITIKPIQSRHKTVVKNVESISHIYFDIGSDPIGARKNHQKHSIGIDQLLTRMGYNKKGELVTDSISLTVDGVVECNTDPVIQLNDGTYYNYQRSLVWDLEDKQKLIRSIYNGIPIGNFVFREKTFDMVNDHLRDGHPNPSWNDLVDGKQRFDAILSFIQGKYPDRLGNYWGDLSIRARSKFYTYNNLMFIGMQEDTTDMETLEYFILLNDTGKQVDRSLLETNKVMLDSI